MNQVTFAPPRERPTLDEVRYSHEACIDLVILRPGITQREIARYFGYTEAWMSTVFRSDAFKAALAAKKDEVIGPLFAAMEEKLSAASHAALDRLTERLLGPAVLRDSDLIRGTEVLLSATGYGARVRDGGPTTQVVINMPGKATNEAAWAAKYTPGGASLVLDANGGTPGGG